MNGTNLSQYYLLLDDAQSSNHSFTVRSFVATVVGSLIMDKGGTGQVHYCNLKIEKTK